MMKSLLENLGKWTIYAVVFLTPLFFLPFTVEFYEFNKLFLLFTLILIGFSAWIAKAIFVERALVFKRTPFDLWLLLFFVALVIGSIFSQDWRNSVFGLYGRFSNSIIEYGLWTAFYFLITQSLTPKEGKRMLTAFLYSSFFVAVSFLCWFFGITSFLHISTKVFVSALGISPQAVAMFSALALILLLGEWVFSKAQSKLSTIFYSVLFALDLLVLIIIHFSAAWIILLLALSGLIFFSLSCGLLQGKETNRLALPLLVIFVSLLLFIFPSFFNISPIGSEVLLDHHTSWKVSIETLKHFPFTGVGLGNWQEAFASFKPLVFNQTPFWDYRFDTPTSYYAYLLGTTGIIGIATFLILLFSAGVFFWKGMIKKEERLKGFKKALLPLLCGFSGFVVAMFFYYQPISLGLIFYLFLATAGLFMAKEFSFPERRKELSVMPAANLFLTFFFLIAIFFVGGGIFYAGRFYYADVLYQRAQAMPNSPPKIALLNKAVTYDPFYIEYSLALAQTSLNFGLQEILKPQNNNKDAVSKLIPYISFAVQTVNNAVTVVPKRAEVWELRGLFYQEVRPLDPKNAQIAQLAAQSFTNASSLNNTNPTPLIELARMYLSIGDFSEAKSALAKARALKPDFTAIDFTQALIKEKEGKPQEAIALLQGILKNPTQLPRTFVGEFAYNLGRIYSDNQDYAKAIDALNLSLQANPDYENARYLLGVVYEHKGDTKQALEQYKKLLISNPGNQELEKRIKALEK